MDGKESTKINNTPKGRVSWHNNDGWYTVVEADGSRVVNDLGYPLDNGGFDSVIMADAKVQEINSSRR